LRSVRCSVKERDFAAAVDRTTRTSERLNHQYRHTLSASHRNAAIFELGAFDHVLLQYKHLMMIHISHVPELPGWHTHPADSDEQTLLKTYHLAARYATDSCF